MRAMSLARLAALVLFPLSAAAQSPDTATTTPQATAARNARWSVPVKLEGVPNLVTVFGYTNASWTLRADLAATFATNLVATMHQRGLRQVTPTNDEGDVGDEPLLGLSSGYVQRAADRMPKSGSRAPWQMTQSWVRDRKLLGSRAILDPALRFSVTDGRAKTINLRRDPRASFHVTTAGGWSYAVAEGTAELSPVASDPADATVEELIEIFRAIRGEHPDWQEYRNAMVADRRLVIRLPAQRVYGWLRPS